MARRVWIHGRSGGDDRRGVCRAGSCPFFPNTAAKQEKIDGTVPDGSTRTIHAEALFFLRRDFWRVRWVVELPADFFPRSIWGGRGHGRNHDRGMWARGQRCQTSGGTRGRSTWRPEVVEGRLSRARRIVLSAVVVAGTILGVPIDYLDRAGVRRGKRRGVSSRFASVPGNDGHRIRIYRSSRWSRRVLPSILVWFVKRRHRNLCKRISGLGRPRGSGRGLRTLDSTELMKLMSVAY